MGGGGGGGMGGMITNIVSSVANVGAGHFANDRLNKGTDEALLQQDQANALYGDLYGQSSAQYAPYQNAGTTALDALMETYGLGTNADFTQSAEYQQAKSAWDSSGGAAAAGDDSEADPFSGRNIAFGVTGLGGGGPFGYMLDNYNDGRGGPQQPVPQKQPFEQSEQYRAAQAKWQASQPQGGADFSRFINSPDYQFNLQQGLKARDMSAASTGRLYSGAYDKALQGYGQGLASNQLNTYRTGLGNIANMGLNSTNALSNYRMGYGNQLGQGYENKGDLLYARRIGQANINYRNVAAQDSIWGAGSGGQQGGGGNQNALYGGSSYGGGGGGGMGWGADGSYNYGSVANNFNWG